MFTKVSYWLDGQASEIEYSGLKTFLLKKFTMTPAERTQRILDMTKHSNADQSPRELWDEIQSLVRLPEIDPITQKHSRLNLERQIWLRTLPETFDHYSETQTNHLSIPLLKKLNLYRLRINLHDSTLSRRRPRGMKYVNLAMSQSTLIKMHQA